MIYEFIFNALLQEIAIKNSYCRASEKNFIYGGLFEV